MNLTMLDSLWNQVMGHDSVLTIDVPPFVVLQGGKEFMSMWNVSWKPRKKGIIKINCFSLIGLEYMVTAQTFFACLLQSYQKRKKERKKKNMQQSTRASDAKNTRQFLCGMITAAKDLAPESWKTGTPMSTKLKLQI